MREADYIIYFNDYRKFCLQAATTGEITFQEEFSVNSTAPLIAPEWFVNHEGNTLYARITEDESTLKIVRDILQIDNPQMAAFMPSLAVIITWHNDNSTKVRCLFKSYVCASKCVARLPQLATVSGCIVCLGTCT